MDVIQNKFNVFVWNCFHRIYLIIFISCNSRTDQNVFIYSFFYSKGICQQTLNPGCLCIWKFLNWFDLMRKYAELCQCKAMQCTVFRHSHHFCNNRVTILIGPSNLYDTQCKQNKCITTVKKNQIDSEWFDVLSPYHTLWLVGQDRATAKIWLACNDSILICIAAWMLIYWLTILNWVGPTW